MFVAIKKLIALFTAALCANGTTACRDPAGKDVASDAIPLLSLPETRGRSERY